MDHLDVGSGGFALAVGAPWSVRVGHTLVLKCLMRNLAGMNIRCQVLKQTQHRDLPLKPVYHNAGSIRSFMPKGMIW